MLLEFLAAGVANPGFDVEAASRAYLDTLQGAARAKRLAPSSCPEHYAGWRTERSL